MSYYDKKGTEGGQTGVRLEDDFDVAVVFQHERISIGDRDIGSIVYNPDKIGTVVGVEWVALGSTLVNKNRNAWGSRQGDAALHYAGHWR